MLSLHNLRVETNPLLNFIDAKWAELKANARNGHPDHFSDWRLMAATSADGHLDDLDPNNPYILFLPNDFITPGGRFMVQFYWDSYFIILGLLGSGHVELAKGMVENCLFLVQRHGMVIANRKRWAAGSQLPFLSRMVLDMYKVTGDRVWLQQAVQTIETEYKYYWMNQDHLSHRGLSRYHAPSVYPVDHIPEITMDHEATWDLSPRFDKEDVLQLLPVDLNCNLLAYEKHLAYFHTEMGSADQAGEWSIRAEQRADAINELMWDDDDGLYYDFNFVLGERKKIKSLVTFFPLFEGLANAHQAKRVADNLCIFESEFGLTTCDRTYGYLDRQWNYPLGWAPLHWIVYFALKHQGHTESASRVALKWLELNLSIWRKTGKLFEKYDVVNGTEEALTDRYKNQEGFGWTNGVFISLVNDLVSTC